MTGAELAQRLDAKRNGRGWVANCPAHDDKTPSLGIDEAPDGRALVHCRAGCTQDAVLSALRARGLWAPEPGTNRKPTPTKTAPARKSGKVHLTLDDAARAACWAVGKATGEEWTETRRDIYKAAGGDPVAAVLRFDRADGATDADGKAIKSFRPLHAVAGGWALGDPPGLWPLFRLPEIVATDAALVFCEGEKAATAGAEIGLVTTATAHGAQAPAKTDFAPVAGRHCVIVPDNDGPGRRYGEAVAHLCHDAGAKSVRIVKLPGLPKKGDLADMPATTETAELVKRLAREAPAWEPTEAGGPSTEATGKPLVTLPAGDQSITDAGRTLGELLGRTQRFFNRGGAVMRLEHDTDGLPVLHDVKPAALASDFETVAFLCKPGKPGKDGKPKLEAATCPEQTAKLLQASAAFREILPPIHVLTRCPVLIERNGKLIQICGYDRESGTLAGGDPAENMPLADGVRLLCELVEDFRFATPADRARALAAIITPALVLGGLLRARAPVDLGEADASQSGKGFKVKLKTAVYGEAVKVITQQKSGGVGSLEEAFNAALIRGACFICLDNVRGKIDSPAFESFLTEDHYTARAAFIPNTDIDPRRVCIMFTSNKADVTTDLANRSSCVRILKQRDGYTFSSYPEGDILDHVRANQPQFLGAVFAVVQAWFDAGRPRTTETRHDFRPWAQTLDWITRNLLDAGPLLDGHRETQARMTNPVLNWLRDVALEVIRAQQGGVWLRAGDMVDLLAETGTETPGLPEHGDPTDPDTRKAAQQATGRKLGLCFRAGEVVCMDGMTIERREEYDPEGRYTVREYRFTAAAMESEPLAASAATKDKPHTEQTPELPLETPSCGYETPSCGYAAASPAANKTPVAANAADTYLKGQSFDQVEDNNTPYIPTMETISRIAATDAGDEPPELPLSIDIEEGEL
jgi:hypothetical protein